MLFGQFFISVSGRILKSSFTIWSHLLYFSAIDALGALQSFSLFGQFRAGQGETFYQFLDFWAI